MIESRLEKILEYPERGLRTHPGKLLFGPVSERLFADCLDRKPGFCGNIDFIHKVNIDVLFETMCSTNPDWTLAKTVWYPTRLVMSYEDDDIVFEESKLLSQNDIAYSVQKWTNKSSEDISVELIVNPSCPVRKDGKYHIISSDKTVHGVLINAVVGWNMPEDKVIIKSGDSIEIIAAAAVGNQDSDPIEETVGRLEEFFALELTPLAYIEKGIKEYEDFFKDFPEFVSDDPVLNKTWWYRMYILRNATSNPGYGLLQYRTVYEGRAHKTNKDTPFSTGGWEFSRLISLSSPLHMTDYRWFNDKELLHEFVRGYYSCLTEEGLNASVFVNHSGGSFANFLVWAIYRMYLVDGDLEFVKEMLPMMKKNVDGVATQYASNNDSLIVEVKHQHTGKECQPSFWYFNDYPQFSWERKRNFTPLKRVDSSIYHYLNTLGLSKMMEATGNSEAKLYKDKAEKIAEELNIKSWDEESHFYYDLHHETDEKAMVKNIVGVYPYWAGITEKSRLDGFNYVFDKEVFNTGCLFATTEQGNIAYSPIGAWKGLMTGRDSCMWNGPSWPYTNGIVLDAMGKQSRLNEHCYDTEFAKYLRDYSMQHYRYGNINFPYLVEQYNAVTGEDISDEPDYNHSYYMDLIMNYVVGLDLREDEIVIDPIDIGLKKYDLSNLEIRGHKIEVHYDKKNGMTLISDGKALLSNEKSFPAVVEYKNL